MACTTILVGKKATNDGSTIISRTDDGHFDVKKTIIVEPKKQKKKYKSVIGHLEIELPDNPLKYSCSPSVSGKHGIWAASGINELNVGMTATETITSNPRVLAADPLVVYEKSKKRGEKDKAGGIGEEDMVVITLPYIKSAREGVIRLGSLLEKYGTYESNGIAFNDENEVWWLETIGGHNWIARRVEDDEYVIMPNQFGLDRFDFADAYSGMKSNMCSKGLRDLVKDFNLDLNNDGDFNPRLVFGSRSDADHVYNTPRGWFIGRYFNPITYKWDGEGANFNPQSDNIPWSLRPERKITIEEIKYILSSYYQGTPYNPYGSSPQKGIYRPIGISRTGVTVICQIRNGVKDEIKGVEWISYGSNAHNALVPFYTSVNQVPKYLSNVTLDCKTDNLYWNSRLIAALSDPYHSKTAQILERYQEGMLIECRKILNEYDKKYQESLDKNLLNEANDKICKKAEELTQNVLNSILLVVSEQMKNGYSRSDN